MIFPLGRMWRSPDPIDAYGLNHLTSVAGDALLAISLSDSVFFSVPVGEARLKVAAYLALTMLPLALAGPLIVPILDRAGPRRSVTFAAALGRSLLAIVLAPRLSTTMIFPLALAMLVLSKIHGIVKNQPQISQRGIDGTRRDTNKASAASDAADSRFSSTNGDSGTGTSFSGAPTSHGCSAPGISLFVHTTSGPKYGHCPVA